MFEHRYLPLLPRKYFLHRLTRSTLLGLFLILISLGAGMLGYRTTEEMAWDDAFANAAMILAGMGPLEPMHTTAGKLFAGFYALYSGFALVAICGIVFAPVIHRFLHRFHLGIDQRSGGAQRGE